MDYLTKFNLIEQTHLIIETSFPVEEVEEICICLTSIEAEISFHLGSVDKIKKDFNPPISKFDQK